MIDSQIIALEDILSDIQRGEKTIARDKIVTLMSREKGIASWATALRMVTDNLVL